MSQLLSESNFDSELDCRNFDTMVTSGSPTVTSKIVKQLSKPFTLKKLSNVRESSPTRSLKKMKCESKCQMT